MAAINPYLTFDGKCEEAFNFYKSTFGGDFIFMGKFKDIPSEKPMPESEANRVMHVALPISKETILMGSDTSNEAGHQLNHGNSVSISINCDSEAEATKLFDGLSKGGLVTMPLNKTFWNAFFGMFTDKFGIHWMVNYDYSQNK
jgi:PhnB protein